MIQIALSNYDFDTPSQLGGRSVLTVHVDVVLTIKSHSNIYTQRL